MQCWRHPHGQIWSTDAVAHYALGDILFWLGALLPARTHVAQSIALYHPQQHSALAFLYGEDARVFSLSYMSDTLWWLGYPHQAVQKSQEALAVARRHTRLVFDTK